jgi:hypothetical protein
MRTVWSYLAILEQETGGRSTTRSLDRARDLDEVTAGYAGTSSLLSP